MQVSEQSCHESQKEFIVRKPLPLGGQAAKEYKALVQLGKAIFLAFCGAVTGLEEKLEKQKSEREFTSAPSDS